MQMNSFLPPRRLVAVLAAVCLALAASECRKKTPAPPEPSSAAAPAASPVVLRVETTAYTLADFESYLRLNAGDEWRTLAAQALSGLFDNYVEEKILSVQARKRHIVPTDAEVDDYLFRLKSAAGIGSPAAEFDPQAVRDKLQVEKYLSVLIGGVSVPEAEVTAYYDAHKSEFLQAERVQVSQILCETEGEATEVLNGLKNATETQFREAVKARSKGVEAAKGGLLGVFHAGQLPADLEKVILALKPGEISRIVESSYGFHIFRLDRRFPPKLQTLIEARPAITSKLLDQLGQAAVADHVRELKASLDWKAETGPLPFIYQRNDT
jgi:hypothetical protein